MGSGRNSIDLNILETLSQQIHWRGDPALKHLVSLKSSGLRVRDLLLQQMRMNFDRKMT